MKYWENIPFNVLFYVLFYDFDWNCIVRRDNILLKSDDHYSEMNLLNK
jgi:hypothetical protein